MIFLYYIQEADKLNLIFKLFNIIKLQDDKIILPIKEGNKISKKKCERLAKKVNKLLMKTNCKKVVVSKFVKEQEEFLNYLYTYNCQIVDGKLLFEILSQKVLDYTIKKKKLKKQEVQLSILVNNLSDIMLENIKELAKQYKKVNIVTNHIQKFKKIEEEMLEEQGIMIVITNNKKRSLARSQMILNVDFPTELINQYNIYENAIIINIKEEVKIKKKRFNGISINDYGIKFEQIEEFDYDKMQKFYHKDLYEAQFNLRQPLKNSIRKINRDKVEIEKLIATNTIL